MLDNREGSRQPKFSSTEPPFHPDEPDSTAPYSEDTNPPATDTPLAGEVRDALSDSDQEIDEDKSAVEEDNSFLGKNQMPDSDSARAPYLPSTSPSEIAQAPIGFHEEQHESGEHLDVVQDSDQTGIDRTAVSAEEAAANHELGRQVYTGSEQDTEELA